MEQLSLYAKIMIGFAVASAIFFLVSYYQKKSLGNQEPYGYGYQTLGWFCALVFLIQAIVWLETIGAADIVIVIFVLAAVCVLIALSISFGHWIGKASDRRNHNPVRTNKS